MKKSKKKISIASRKKIGKQNRAAGARFERKVRRNLEEKKWIVDKWTNTVDLEMNILVSAKRRFNPYLKALSMANGFPDFICFKLSGKKYDVIGVEVKRRGYLDKKEKEMCEWHLKNRIFSKILIAKEKRNGRSVNVEYAEFGK